MTLLHLTGFSSWVLRAAKSLNILRNNTKECLHKYYYSYQLKHMLPVRMGIDIPDLYGIADNHSYFGPEVCTKCLHFIYMVLQKLRGVIKLLYLVFGFKHSISAVSLQQSSQMEW